MSKNTAQQLGLVGPFGLGDWSWDAWGCRTFTARPRRRRRGQVHRHLSIACWISASTFSTPRTPTAPPRTNVSSAVPIRDRRDQVVLATKFGNREKRRRLRFTASMGWPEVRAAGVRCVTAASRAWTLSISTISIASIPKMPIEDTVGAMADLQSRKGPAPGIVGSSALDDSPRSQRVSHHCAPD